MIRTLLLFIIFPFFTQAQTIPASMRVDWSNAGNQAIVTQPFTSVNMANFGAVGDSATDNSLAFSSAILWLNGIAGVLEVPPGKYLFRSPITLNDSVIIRGINSDSTRFYFDLNGSSVNCINIERSQSNAFVPALSGYTKGSDSLIVSSAVGLSAGDIIELRQQNGAWDAAPASWAAYSVGQMMKITSVSGNTIYLAEEIRLDYDPLLNPEVRKVDAIKHTGIECIGIQRLDQATAGYNISFSYAENCWLKGIESSRSNGAHVSIAASSHIEITGSYLHHAFAYDGTSTRGYGVMLSHHASDCLIENNIFRHLRHSMMVKQGANGNVLAYNYSFDPFRTEIPTNAGGDISLHGHYAFANLFEGNVVQNIHIDKTWGPSGPYNTFFRNMVELYGVIMSQDTINSDMQNFVGNEITNPSTGLYVLAGTGHFLHGNNHNGTITPAGTNSLPDNSYYLTSVPSFWSNLPWPNIGTPYNFNTGTIPSEQRFVQGIYTTCASQTLSVTEAKVHEEVNIYPNPFDKVLYIELLNEGRIQLKDIAGRIISEKDINYKTVIDTRELPAGIYLLKITSTGKDHYSKIIKAY